MQRQADIAFFCDARAVHFKKWIEALTERGYELDVFSPWQDPESQNRHQAYTTLKAPFPLPTAVKTLGKAVMRARNGRLIKHRLKQNPPKLVHAHFLLDSGWMAAQLDMHPFVVTVHGSDLLIHPDKSRIQNFVAKQVLKRCDRVVIVSEHLREKLRPYQVPEHKIRHVPSFIDTSRFFPNNRPARAPIVIGSARNFKPVYDVATLLKAVPILAGDHLDIEVHLAGDGTQKEHLEKLAAELGVKNKVKFLGFLDQKQLADFFRKIDVYVSTALSDGLSVTLLEATACGAFPVVADIAGNRSAFQLGLEGRLFEAQNPQDLAAKLKDLLRQRETAFQAGKRNSEIISRSFGKEVVVDKMIEVYDELLTSN